MDGPLEMEALSQGYRGWVQGLWDWTRGKTFHVLVLLGLSLLVCPGGCCVYA
ncbi:uncharacterized protein CYBJADRAFT_169652 [Cyberlindnera jadinii NRRL Y-1542]|uniref:Uncharacterized protein n=1 Tax=Cyberlindnera jadinii (strain ATCC 18201 / CBS 1600 / BCRC 20928 / JCM 3617 / NBRC 0987 / NRRL Y-1542) TaxID=983966 RepID=A0A1E4RV14_CYBJN|nr:hypothetical protein CYBJADRAFT_169652 [Cyberlindnera jadinii NRRL Y-1542]ODV71102.1 hypothetical protein CYBJADRAFT_169652 [Cyberlindnera jadinii NRRL Y-1542]